MVHIVTSQGWLTLNRALLEGFVPGVATIQQCYRVPLDTFVLLPVLKLHRSALVAIFALATRFHHRLADPDTFVPQVPLTSTFVR